MSKIHCTLSSINLGFVFKRTIEVSPFEAEFGRKSITQLWYQNVALSYSKKRTVEVEKAEVRDLKISLASKRQVASFKNKFYANKRLNTDRTINLMQCIKARKTFDQ